MTEQKMRIQFIDGLRFYAAIAVVAQHALELLNTDFFRPFLSLSPGVFGVVMFFIISGYVIPFSLRTNTNVVNFFIRRVFRIFPAYLVVLAITILIGVMRYSGPEGNSPYSFS